MRFHVQISVNDTLISKTVLEKKKKRDSFTSCMSAYLRTPYSTFRLKQGQHFRIHLPFFSVVYHTPALKEVRIALLMENVT